VARSLIGKRREAFRNYIACAALGLMAFTFKDFALTGYNALKPIKIYGGYDYLVASLTLLLALIALGATIYFGVFFGKAVEQIKQNMFHNKIRSRSRP